MVETTEIRAPGWEVEHGSDYNFVLSPASSYTFSSLSFPHLKMGIMKGVNKGLWFKVGGTLYIKQQPGGTGSLSPTVFPSPMAQLSSATCKMGWRTCYLLTKRKMQDARCGHE